MASELGDLPSFGARRSKRGREAAMDLDTALGSLLGDDTGGSDSGGGGKPSGSRTAAGKEGRDQRSNNFYSQMATDVIDEFDMSDDEEVVSEKGSKELAAALDVDNLDANLFGTIGKKRSRDRGPKVPPNNGKPLKGIVKDITVKSAGEETALKSSEKPSFKPFEKPSTPNGEAVAMARKRGDEDLDDLLDLLSTDEEPPKTKSKPKLASSDTLDSNPIILKEETEKSVTQVPSRGQHGEATLTQQLPWPSASLPPSRPPAKGKPSSGPQINFDDDDDDDLLSGLGFDEGKKRDQTGPTTVQKSPNMERKASSLAAPGPKKGRAVSMEEGEKTMASLTPNLKEESTEEAVQFGGYVPSIANSSRPRSVAGRKRRAESEFISSRPSTAPSGSKKTVRFSDDLEATENLSPPVSKSGTQKEPLKKSSSPEEEKAAKSPRKFPEPSSSPQSKRQDRTREDSNFLETSPPKIPRHTSLQDPSSSTDNFLDMEPMEVPQEKGGAVGEEVVLEHPVFPWQKARGSKAASGPPKRQRDRQVVADEGITQRDSSAVFEGDSKELKMAQEKIRELQSTMEKNRKLHEESLSEVKKQAEEASAREKRLEEEGKELKEKLVELEEARRKEDTALREQLEECKMKLYKCELELKQLQQVLESSKQRHEEEIEAMQKCHNLRLTNAEESLARRESRWKEELESEGVRWQEKIQNLEREKADAVLSLKKKIDSMEVSRTNEISRLQAVHRSTIEDLKREQEQDRQHLISMHHQEMEAVKAAHSNTRILAELNSKVEASTREVSQLQMKLSDTHTRLIEERTLKNKTQEHHLKVLEERLLTQQADNEAERERLQSLVAKLEAHISQQSRTMEQERWQQQQDAARLKAQHTSFLEEKNSAMNKLEEERAQFQATKERFLKEQQEILTKCYEEQRLVAAERAEVAQLRKKAEEREAREQQKSVHLSEEQARVAADELSLHKQWDEIKEQRTCLEKDQKHLEIFAEQVRRRSQEVDELCKATLEVRKTAEQELEEARKLKAAANGQSSNLVAEFAQLKEREYRLAQETLSIAEQKRQLEAESSSSSSSYQNRLNHLPPKLQEILLNTGTSFTSFSTSYHDNQQMEEEEPQHQYGISGHQPVPQQFSSSLPITPSSTKKSEVPGYSPRASPSHLGSGPDVLGKENVNSQSVGSYLAQIEHNINLRQMAAAAEKDYEDLEKSREFLASLPTSPTTRNKSWNFKR